MECSRSNSSLSDLKQRISKMPEQNAEGEHKVREEHSRHCFSDCIILSNREGGGLLLHQPDRREREREAMMMTIVILPLMIRRC